MPPKLRRFPILGQETHSAHKGMHRVLKEHYLRHFYQFIPLLLGGYYVCRTPYIDDPKIDVFDLLSIALLTLIIPLLVDWVGRLDATSPQSNPFPAVSVDEDDSLEPPTLPIFQDTSVDDDDILESPTWSKDIENNVGQNPFVSSPSEKKMDASEETSLQSASSVLLAFKGTYSNLLWVLCATFNSLLFERYVGWNDDGLVPDASELLFLASLFPLVFWLIPRFFAQSRDSSFVRSLLVTPCFVILLCLINVPGNLIRQAVVPMVWSVEPNGYITKGDFVQHPHVIYASSNPDRFLLNGTQSGTGGDLSGLQIGHLLTAEFFVDFRGTAKEK